MPFSATVVWNVCFLIQSELSSRSKGSSLISLTPAFLISATYFGWKLGLDWRGFPLHYCLLPYFTLFEEYSSPFSPPVLPSLGPTLNTPHPHIHTYPLYSNAMEVYRYFRAGVYKSQP